MDPYIGEIRMFAGTFAPRGWMFCTGQLLSIAQNSALFSILGTNYGGDGVSTFGLPNLAGRVPVGTGQGPGLSRKELGQMGGTESVTLLSNQMPAHTHGFAVSNTNGDTTVPAAGAVLAVVNTGGREPEQHPAYLASGTPNTPLNPASVQPAGGSQPHDNMMPYLGMNYIIAVEGLYPPRP
ncbi:phage tail protein [Flaviaesturariibacter flavus]|uniref:Phage tail protein n=1 Tax=Flaviaesturariibacter flavus TaxID=2502780 RepID=A0A4R1B3H1_9BACT|nr:tail fiber protein [Flaviaesturariibacter flavus]TCJ12642.1 phage tail protein [Flaviaesturariibacter flavus]